MKNIIYLFLISLIIPFGVNAEESGFNSNIEKFYCTDTEVEGLILNSRERALEKVVRNRESISSFKERRVYETVMGANVVEEEGACAWLTLPSFRKLYQDSVEGFKSILNTIQSFADSNRGIAIPPIDIDMNKLMRKLAEDSCRAVDGLIDTAASDARSAAEYRAFEKLSGTVLGGFYHDYYLERAVDNLMEDRFIGSEYLEWRGGYDGGLKTRDNEIKYDSENRVRNAVRGLF